MIKMSIVHGNTIINARHIVRVFITKGKRKQGRGVITFVEYYKVKFVDVNGRQYTTYFNDLETAKAHRDDIVNKMCRYKT